MENKTNISSNDKQEYKDFGSWLYIHRYRIILSMVIPLIPFLLESDWAILKPDKNINSISIWIYEQIYYNINQVVTVVFIIITFIILAKSTRLLSKDNKKEMILHQYAREKFGADSKLVQNKATDLYNRIRIGIEQFYFSWLAVWVVWLLLYTLKFIFATYIFNMFRGKICDDLSEHSIFRLSCLFENSLNLLNSFILLFIYLVITTSTVRVGSLTDDGRKTMHAGVCIFLLVGMGCFFTDAFSLSKDINPESYQLIQHVLRLIIGIFGCISLMAVLGRLNTNFLNIPQWMMFTLYLYAAVQMFYPFSYDSYYKSPLYREKGNTERNIEAHSTVFENFNADNIYFINNKTKDSKATNIAPSIQKREMPPMAFSQKEKQHDQDIFTKAITRFLYFYALIGKGCLCLVLCWVNQKNRFLFFLIHKANTLSDSEVMLQRFNQYYENNNS